MSKNPLRRPRGVVLISPYPPQRGGVAEYSQSLAEELAKHVRVTVLAQRDATARDSVSSSGVDVRRVWDRNSLLTPLVLFRDLLEIRPDAVHIQFESYGLFGTYDFLTTLVFIRLMKLAQIRVVITLHSFLISPSERTSDLDYRRSASWGKALKYVYQVLRLTLRVGLGSVDSIIVHSDFAARNLRRLGSEAAAKTRVIPIGSTIGQHGLTKEESRTLLGLDARRVVLFFGFISESKNIHELVEASPEILAKIPGSIVIISGVPSSFDPNAVRYYERLRKEASWSDRVIFFNRFIDSQELDRLFWASDILVLTYSISQGSSAALGDALGHGIPVVVRNGGIAAIDAEANGFGLTYEAGNTADLANKVIQILSDESLEVRLEARALETGKSRSWGSVVMETLKTYDLRGSNDHQG